MNKSDLKILIISIFIIWLFQISGALGIILGNDKWFIRFTPICLFVYFILIILNNRPFNYNFLFISYFLGFICELIGVNTGILFGDYTYGDTLGIQLFNIPLIIGINWFVTVIISASIADKFAKKIYFKMIISLLLIMFLDISMEPIAPKMDMWRFTGYDSAPLSNYVTWIFISLPLLIFYFKNNINANFYLCVNLYTAQILFFIVLELFYL